MKTAMFIQKIISNWSYFQFSCFWFSFESTTTRYKVTYHFIALDIGILVGTRFRIHQFEWRERAVTRFSILLKFVFADSLAKKMLMSHKNVSGNAIQLVWKFNLHISVSNNIYFFIHLAVKAACKQSSPARKSWTKKIPY